jgi:ubiquinone/menaquinone biosynthesis C-methylase UbiE
MDGREFMFTVDPEGNETRALHSLVDFTDKDVIEIGAGDGRMTWRFAESTRSVTALDPIGSDIEVAIRTTPADVRERVRFLAVDATTYRYPGRRYDVAVLSHSLC